MTTVPSQKPASRPSRRTLPSPAGTRLNGPDAIADTIARVAPFAAWPQAVLSTLARASAVSVHASGSYLLTVGEPCDTMTLIAEGTVVTSVSSTDGRRQTYKIDDAPFAYGLASLLDGLAVQVDLIADGPVTAIRIPHAVVRAELTRMPALWGSIAVETNRRSRGYATQLNQFVFDAPLVRTAGLLLNLLAKSGKAGDDGAATVAFRLSQERLAEMLGTSRQWATSLVRDLSKAGLVDWRYGRVTVLDVPALRRLAAKGINAMDPRVAASMAATAPPPRRR